MFPESLSDDLRAVQVPASVGATETGCQSRRATRGRDARTARDGNVDLVVGRLRPLTREPLHQHGTRLLGGRLRQCSRMFPELDARPSPFA